jgi:TadE-like protein
VGRVLSGSDRVALLSQDAAVRRAPRRPAGPTGKPVAPAGVGRARRWRRDRGSNAVELAILLPTILTLMFLGIQLALYFLAVSEAQGAAQAGVNAQRGYLSPMGTGRAAARAYVNSRPGWFILAPPPSAPPPPPPPPASPPVTISFTVTGHSMSIIPWWNGWKVGATANGPVERFSQSGDQ